MFDDKTSDRGVIGGHYDDASVPRAAQDRLLNAFKRRLPVEDELPDVSSGLHLNRVAGLRGTDRRLHGLKTGRRLTDSQHLCAGLIAPCDQRKDEQNGVQCQPGFHAAGPSADFLESRMATSRSAANATSEYDARLG